MPATAHRNAPMSDHNNSTFYRQQLLQWTLSIPSFADSITRTTALWIRFRRAPLLRLPRDRPSPTVIAEETSRLSTLIVVRKRQSPPKLLSTEETRNYKDWILLNKRDQKSMQALLYNGPRSWMDLLSGEWWLVGRPRSVLKKLVSEVR